MDHTERRLAVPEISNPKARSPLISTIATACNRFTRLLTGVRKLRWNPAYPSRHPMPALPTESLLRRAAIGFWFWLIAALGLVQFHGRAFRTGAFEPGPIAWTWLAGSIVLILAGLFIVVRAARYTSTSHVDQT